MNHELIHADTRFGIFAGAIYGIAAMGLALVFGVLKILNIAHGELVMLGGYVGFWAFSALGWDPFLALIIVIPAIFMLGLILDRVVYRYIVRPLGRGEDQELAARQLRPGARAPEPGAVALHRRRALGSGLLCGPGPRRRRCALARTRAWPPWAIVLVITVALHFFLRKTYPGKAILATAEDYESAELAGININRVYMLTFALGAALAGVAGQFVTFTYSLAPSIGMFWTLKAMIVIVLAGTG